MNTLFLSSDEKIKNPKENVCECSTLIWMSMNVLVFIHIQEHSGPEYFTISVEGRVSLEGEGELTKKIIHN